MKKLILFLIPIILLGCHSEKEKNNLEKSVWKFCGDVGTFSDVLDFRKDYSSIKNDSIYINWYNLQNRILLRRTQIVHKRFKRKRWKVLRTIKSFKVKKVIALSLSIITIIICGWLILKNIDHLDIASNKTDWYAMDSKRKIDERIDIDFCEKQILKDRIDQSRNNARIESNMAFETQVFAFIIIIVQLVLLVFIIMMPSKLKNLV